MRGRPAVNHIAIDIGGRESQICLKGPDKAVLEEKRVETRLGGDLREASASVLRGQDGEGHAAERSRTRAASDRRARRADRAVEPGARGTSRERTDLQAADDDAWSGAADGGVVPGDGGRG